MRSQTVRGPGTQAGSTGDLVAGLHGGDRRLVIDGLGVQTAHPADFVRFFRKPGQQLGVHPHAALAHLLELVLRRGNRKTGLTAGHGRQPLALANGVGQVLVVPLLHYRLVVEQIHLRRTADHVQVDDPFGVGGTCVFTVVGAAQLLLLLSSDASAAPPSRCLPLVRKWRRVVAAWFISIRGCWVIGFFCCGATQMVELLARALPLTLSTRCGLPFSKPGCNSS